MSYVQETQQFFESRAAGWEDRFPDDDPLFKAAISELNLPLGARVLDAGCGSGRALPMLRQTVGEGGIVAGADLTPGMIAEANRRGRSRLAHLLVADVLHLPFGVAQFQAVFAAGLIPHLRDPLAGLIELARITSPGGTLAIFQPIGRAALAARHGHTPSDDDALATGRLINLLHAAGWSMQHVDDGANRYLATAIRLQP